MLKPLTTKYKGREITLECTHKKTFPPPQMYGHTPEDIDTLWKQGVIDQNQHQHLTVWKDKCGLMVMGPRCLDCPLALKQNPRPGRPNVIETEPWLSVKNKIHWEDMAKNKEMPPVPVSDRETPVDPLPVEEPEETRYEPLSKETLAKEMIDNGILDSEPETPPSMVPDKKPLDVEIAPHSAEFVEDDPDDEIEEEAPEPDALDEGILDILADDD